MATILKVILSLAGFVGPNLAFAGDVLRIPMHASSLNLNPSGVQDAWSLWVSRQINCQLVRTSAMGLSEDAAENIKFVSPTQIEMTLRERKFADGSVVKADDVIASLEWFRAKRKIFRNLFGWVAEMKARGPKVVVIKLKKASPDFLKLFAAPNYAIYPAAFLKKAEADPTAWNAPIGCGKYRVENFSAESVKLQPIGKGLPIQFDLKEGESLTAAEAASYDLLPRPYYDGQMRPTGFEVIASFDPKQMFLSVNTTLPRWRNKKARCEFMGKLNVAKIVEAYGPLAERTEQLFPRGVIGYDPSFISSPTETHSGHATKLPGGCISFLGLSVEASLRAKYIEALGPQFGAFRSEVIENPVDFGRSFLRSKCDLFVVGLRSNYLDGYEFLVPFMEPGVDITGLRNQKIMTRIKESQEITDPKERSQEYREIQKEILGECVVKPVTTLPQLTFLMRGSRHMPGIGNVQLYDYDLSEVR